jgi:acyl-homoserine-lactone acylase
MKAHWKISLTLGAALALVITVALVLANNAALRARFHSATHAAPTQSQLALRELVTIYRDEVGVPHIHGRTDAAAAFGFAYAHAEDDFPTIQAALVAARGELGRLLPHKPTLALGNDFMVQLLGVREQAQRQYAELPEDFRSYLTAYADGLNYYASTHPLEADARFFPVSGADITAGFIHKLPLMMGAGRMLENLHRFRPDELTIGAPMQRALDDGKDIPTLPDWYTGKLAGSNAHAVQRKRSTDNTTRLNINSHQPWEGPVAWYEAHLISDEGMNILGGTFPGAPSILHGHNETLGWAHTVNRPDLIDIYKLEVREVSAKVSAGDTAVAAIAAYEYKLDDKWLPLETHKATLRLDLGFTEPAFSKTYYRSAHGPVLKNDAGFYAIRIAGYDVLGKAAWQWWRMGKARNHAQFMSAMNHRYVAMMNTVYADRENVHYLYNGHIPQRPADALVSWKGILPGTDSRLIWHDSLPLKALPQVLNPPSGLVLNTNATPYVATDGPGNPHPQNFPTAIGIEQHMNNRAWRTLHTFGLDNAISREEFLRYKFDSHYSADAGFIREAIVPLLAHYAPEGHSETQALDLLRNWYESHDKNALPLHADTIPGALIKLIEEPWHGDWLYEPVNVKRRPPEALFRAAVRTLQRDFGRVNVSLGQIQRLRRGPLDLPIGGGTDTLASVHTNERGIYRVGTAGDSYILLVEFTDKGVRSYARHQYGNVTRTESPHYADQARAFVAQTLRPSHVTLEQVKTAATRRYAPGEME